jgi:vitamin B12 transporter
VCLAALAAISLHATPARAAEPTQTLVVTGARAPQRVDQTLAELSVISREQIEAAGALSLAELLGREPGIQVWANGGLGKPASVSLRGLEARHTLLLIDGVRYGSATLGTPIWDNLPLEAIERIEIVRGPLSGLYGSDAVGGVVQIFTRSGRQGLHADAAAAIGSQGLREASAGLRFGRSGWDGQVQVQHQRLSGISATNEQVPWGQYNPDVDPWRQSSVQARLGTTLGGWRAQGTVLASNGRTHYDDGEGADAYADVRSNVATVSLEGGWLPGWQTSLRLSRAEDLNDVRASASPWAELGATTTVQRQLSWENRVATPLGRALAVLERVTQDVARPGTPYDVSTRTITALALGLDGQHGPHSWQANVRRDRNSQFGNPSTGALAYGYALNPHWRAIASVGKSFVAPSFNQLYYPGFGNPELLPEEGNQQELALQGQWAGVNARLAWFDNRIRGYISSGPQPTNVPRTRIDGLSASVQAVAGAWEGSASVELLNPVNDTAGSAQAGLLLPRRARETARFSGSWQGRQGWQLGGTIVAVGPRFDDTANTVPLAGYATLDLRALWQINRAWQLGLNLDNALGTRYEAVYGYNPPGRRLRLSLRWSMQ